MLTDKLESKGEKGYFVGYPKETRGYYFYLPERQTVVVSRQAKFLEKDFVFKEQGHKSIELEEIQEPQLDMDTDRLSKQHDKESVGAFNHSDGGSLSHSDPLSASGSVIGVRLPRQKTPSRLNENIIVQTPVQDHSGSFQLEASPLNDDIVAPPNFHAQNDPPIVPTLRKSIRERKEPVRWYGFLVEDNTIDLPDHDDPNTYSEAILDVDSGKWHEAMKSEMDSMYTNQVWDLVELPKGVRPLVASGSLRERLMQMAKYKPTRLGWWRRVSVSAKALTTMKPSPQLQRSSPFEFYLR